MNEPYSHRSEQAIIGAVLQDNSALELVTNALRTRMFFMPQHSRIFKGIEFLYQKGDGVDVISLSNLSEDISEAYLYECINTTLGISNLKTHIGAVLELYVQRVLLKQSIQIQDQVGNQIKTGYEIAKEVSNNLHNIISFKSGAKIISPSNFLTTLAQIRKERKTQQFLVTGYPTLNTKLTTGFPIRTISVIAGCGSQLKSAFRSIIELQMCELGFGVISIAVEQDASTELERKISNMSRVPFTKIVRDIMNDEERKRVKASEEYHQKNYNYHLIADKGASIASIKHSIEATMNKYNGIRIVFIDLFSYLEEVMGAINTPQLLSIGMREIDLMAQEYNLHFCLLVHIKRDAQERSKKNNQVRRPYIHQIKGSGVYQERARMIFLLHRPKYYNREIAEDTLEVNIAKQDNGEAGEGVNIIYDFQPEIFNLTERHESEGFFYGENEDNGEVY